MSLLQELLNVGLVDIGSDDTRFERMQSAAVALGTKLKGEPSLLIPATLICLDDDVDENDPLFGLVEEFVISEWKTLRNTHVNRPRELLRSILIDALATVTSETAETAGVVWNTAASPLRHKQVRLGKAARIIEELTRRAMHSAENEAVSRCGLEPIAHELKLSSDAAGLTVEGAITENDVLTEIARAAGPQYPANQNIEAANMHWPNQGQPWSHEFTPRMTAAVVKAVNLGTTRLAESVAHNVAGPTTEQLKQFQREMLRTQELTRVRLDVLWWSESLYSPSLRIGYRELPLPVAAVVAAADVTAIVPALAPASVCYILGETVNHRLARMVDGDGNQQILTLLETVAQKKIDLGDVFSSQPTSGRSPLLDLVAEASTGRMISSDALRSRAGIDGELSLSPAEFAMWVFRDLQARRLTKEVR